MEEPSVTARIDVHQHMIPEAYRELLAKHGIDAAGGRDLPDWSMGSALGLMDTVGIATTILSVSTPGVSFLKGEAASVAARDLNQFGAELTRQAPERFGFFATLPLPDAHASLEEARFALETLNADGVTMLANSRGVYLGSEHPGSDDLFAYLNQRSAVVFVHPADLPADPVEGIPPFATDFLLDTTRAAYLLVRNGIRERYPNIRFILSHAGGMVPYIAHRMAVSIMSDTGRPVIDVLDELSGFYFDTALSSSPTTLPTLLAFAKPGHILFGSDWPFAPEAAALYFAAGLDTYDLEQDMRPGINRDNALRVFPRLGDAPALRPAPLPVRLRASARRAAIRAVVRRINRG